MKKILLLALILFCFVFLSCKTLCEDQEYSQISEEFPTDNDHTIFIKLKSFLEEYPNSSHAKEIKFAFCEYYFQTNNHRQAINDMAEYLNNYPGEKNTALILAMLYKELTRETKDTYLVEKIKKRFFAKPLFLIFKNAKITQYKSLLNNTYKIIDSVNKIEIIKNNEPFLTIAP